MQAETKLAIAEGKLAVLESVSTRIDQRFDNLSRQITGTVAGHDDAGSVLRRLRAPTTTRQ